MKLRIGKLLTQRGLKQRWLVDQLDVSPGYVSGLVSGSKLPSPQLLQKIAEAFDLPVASLVESRRPVAVAGFVGGGQTVELVDAYEKGGGLFHIAAPEDLPATGIVAAEVRGDSMSPLIEDGDILLFTRNFVGIEPTVIGHVGICQTEDGRALVKKIEAGREEGTFDLYSFNPGNAAEYGVRLIWAAPYRRHLRRQDIEIIEP